MAVAQHFKKKICVDKRRYKILCALDWPRDNIRILKVISGSFRSIISMLNDWVDMMRRQHPTRCYHPVDTVI